MPRLVVETTADRQETLDGRVARRRASVAATCPETRELLFGTAKAACRAAERVSPFVSARADQHGDAYVGVVLLRADQEWLRPEAERMGLRVRPVRKGERT